VGSTKAEVIWKVLIFYAVYIGFLNFFAFIQGTNSLFKTVPSIGVTLNSNKFALLFGLGTYADIPTWLSFIVSIGFLTFIGFLIYEAIVPGK
jgi:hypothetical protein